MLHVYNTAVYSDKDAVYLWEMEQCRRREPGKRMILMVPDQFSYDAEKKLTHRFGGTGLNRIEVMTFRQLTRRFVRTKKLRYFTSAGKLMLLRKAVRSTCGEDSMFYSSVDKPGFYEEIGSLIDELKRYCVTAQMLEDRAEEAQSPLLKKKLSELAAIYETYMRYVSEGGFADSEDDIARAARHIPDCGYFSDAEIWFNEFADFLPQHYDVIDAFLQAGCRVNIFLNCDLGGMGRDIFALSDKTRERLKRICSRRNTAYIETDVSGRKQVCEELRFLCDYYDIPGSVYPEQARNISVFQSRDHYSEIERTAMEITDLVREERYRYQDIAVLCANVEDYIHMIEPVFAEYKIPYFSDYKMPVLENPAAGLAASLFELIEQGKSYEAMFRYLRTGLVSRGQLTDDDIDLLENYVLKRGIRGRMWEDEDYWSLENERIFDTILGDYKTKFTDSSELEPQQRLSPLNRVREIVMTPIMNFTEKTKGHKKVRKIAEAFYEFLEEIELFESIEETVGVLEAAHPNEAAQFARVWTLLSETVEQAVTVIGDDLCTREQFGEYLVQGLAGCEIRIIPTGIDRVAVGSTERAALSSVKVLFILGMNSGAVPMVAASEGLLSDHDRAELEELGTELAPDTKTQALQSEFRLYRNMCCAQNRLYLSFPAADKDGTALQPSQAVTDVLRMFPGCDKDSDLIGENDYLYISSPEATIHRLFVNIGKGRGNHPLWKSVARWYAQQGTEWKERLELIGIAYQFQKSAPKLMPENAQALYAAYQDYSVSKIEKFYQCPFMYFLENGLKVQERETYEVRSADVGDLLHWAVKEYCIRVDNGAKTAEEKHANWEALSREKSAAIVDAIMEEAEQRLKAQPYAPKRQKGILRRAGSVLRRCVETINKSFQKSRYTSAGYEWRFENMKLDGQSSVTVHGVIDRIDLLNDVTDGCAYIRIIDYKSGKKKFSVKNICNKLDLQLMVYAIAALQGYREGKLDGEALDLTPKITGVFYDKINNDYVECGIGEEQELEKKKAAGAMLDGLVYCDPEDGDMKRLYDYDKDLKTGDASGYIKISWLKDRKGLKKGGWRSERSAEAMMDFIRRAVMEADRDIKNGTADIRPYKASGRRTAETACNQYCIYKDVCAFDREKAYQFRILKDEKQAFEEVCQAFEERAKKSGERTKKQ